MTVSKIISKEKRVDGTYTVRWLNSDNGHEEVWVGLPLKHCKDIDTLELHVQEQKALMMLNEEQDKVVAEMSKYIKVINDG